MILPFGMYDESVMLLNQHSILLGQPMWVTRQVTPLVNWAMSATG